MEEKWEIDEYQGKTERTNGKGKDMTNEGRESDERFLSRELDRVSRKQ